MKGEKIQPKVFKAGKYAIKIEDKEVGEFVTKKVRNSEKVRAVL